MNRSSSRRQRCHTRTRIAGRFAATVLLSAAGCATSADHPKSGRTLEADLVVLDRNLFDIEPAAISESQVLLTLLGGETVHGDLSSIGAKMASDAR